MRPNDAKGDKGHREQPTYQYVRVVERRSDGVVVCGSQAAYHYGPYADDHGYSNPGPEEGREDWAIAFAISMDVEGVYLIGRESHLLTGHCMEAPIAEFGDVESFTVLDHVFVPNGGIFINGETDFGGNWPCCSLYSTVTATVANLAWVMS